MKTFSEYMNEGMRVNKKNLLEFKTGTYHSGGQQVSNLDGKDILWNYVYVKNGKYEVTNKEEKATHIAYPTKKGTKVEEL